MVQCSEGLAADFWPSFTLARKKPPELEIQEAMTSVPLETLAAGSQLDSCCVCRATVVRMKATNHNITNDGKREGERSLLG